MPTPTRIGSYSPATASRIYEAIETLEQSGILTRARDRKQPLRSRDPAFPPLKFRNDSGEEVPAYGCMEITGTVRIADVTYFTADKPSSDVATKPVMFNLHNAVADEKFGLADAGVETRALCDNTAAAVGTRFAPNPMSWQMTEDSDGAFRFLGADAIDANAGRFSLVGGGTTEEEGEETNPGVVRVTLTGRSDCTDDRAFDGTIQSRPFAAPTPMRREKDGEIIVYDPSGCMLDMDDEDANGLNVWASLMYGGELLDKGWNFRNTEEFVADGTDETFVLPSDVYSPPDDVQRPAGDCDPFGWTGGSRTGYNQDAAAGANLAGSIGPVVPDGICTFNIELPEKGTYAVTIIYGDETDATDNNIVLKDGDRVLEELDGETDGSATKHITHGPTEYEFKSTHRPVLKIDLSNASGKDTRLNHVKVQQVSEASRWEAINRCCVAGE